MPTKKPFIHEINPTDINAFGNFLDKKKAYWLDLFLKQQEERSKQVGFFSRLFGWLFNQKNKTFIKNTTYKVIQPGSNKPIFFCLTHNITIIHTQLSSIQKKFSEYLVVDDRTKNILGTGRFGKGIRGEGFLIRQNGQLTFKPKAIVDKVQTHGLFFHTRAQVKREEKILRRVHPYAKPIVFEQGHPFKLTSHLVDRYLGVGLDQIIKFPSRYGLTNAKRLLISISLLRKIQELHLGGYIHHDLRPLNILINPITCEVNLIDFGSARKISDRIQKGGNLKFSAPEKFIFWKYPIDKRSDIYSAGLVLANLWGGIKRTPFSFFRALKQLIMKESEPFSLDSLDPPEMRELLRNQMLQFNPANRTPLDSLIHQLEELRLQQEHAGNERQHEAAKKAYYLSANCCEQLLGCEGSTIVLKKIEYILREAIEQLDSTPIQLNEFIRTSGIKSFEKFKDTNKENLLRETKTIISSFSQLSLSLVNTHNRIACMLKLSLQWPDFVPPDYLSFLETKLQDVYRLIYKKDCSKAKLDDMAKLSRSLQKYLPQIEQQVAELEETVAFGQLQPQRNILLKLELEEEKDDMSHLKNRIRIAVREYLMRTFTTANIKRNDRAASERRIKDMSLILNTLDTANDSTITFDSLKQKVSYRLKEIKCGFFNQSKLRDLVQDEMRSAEHSRFTTRSNSTNTASKSRS